MPSWTLLCHGLSSLVVIQISLRGTPESMTPCPTSASLPYASALSLVSNVGVLISVNGDSRVDVSVSYLDSISDGNPDLIWA